jgi:hypothetical protein
MLSKKTVKMSVKMSNIETTKNCYQDSVNCQKQISNMTN